MRHIARVCERLSLRDAVILPSSLRFAHTCTHLEGGQEYGSPFWAQDLVLVAALGKGQHCALRFERHCPKASQ